MRMSPPEEKSPIDAAHGVEAESGSLIERALFNHRLLVLLVCLAATMFFVAQLRFLNVNAGFDKMIPLKHEFIANYMSHKADVAGLANTVRIVVATESGSVFDAGYMETLRKINDEVFLLPGVDRAHMKSLWATSVRWVAVTEDGLDGGPVIPEGFDGSPASLAALQENVGRSGQIGQLVAFDGRSSTILVPLEELGTDGRRLDYHDLSTRLEKLRAKYETAEVKLHIVGFAKVVGDLIDGLRAMLGFFVLAVLICTLVLYWHTRCLRSTLLVVACSLLAVVWLLGMLPTLGYELDPYSILVPFLVFAIGMSHGAQKMNGIMQDIGRGADRLAAARLTFRRLFLPGVTALIADAVGFAVLYVIQIQVIQDLAVTASIGVAILILSNLILLPILLSYIGVSPVAARRSLVDDKPEARSEGRGGTALWTFLGLFTQRKWASIAIAIGVGLGIGGYIIGNGLKVGDLHSGAPELRSDSRYNRDIAYIADHYAASSDVFVVMVSSPAGQCNSYAALSKVDALEWQLQQLPQVESTQSFATFAKRASVGMNEGAFVWYELPRSRDTLNSVAMQGVPRDLINQNCDLGLLFVYLRDHKAESLAGVVHTVQDFAAKNDSVNARFLSAAGNAGVEAATNAVVSQANRQILWLVYAAVGILAYITFRSVKATLCALLPLVLTTILAEALMVQLSIGVKVATLPVIALGVGIGVDYALYVLSVTLVEMRRGRTLSAAYAVALRFTGKVVVLTGATMSIAVLIWAFSPIKFQADMGALLAFMFVWNMLGALILVPALAHFLLRGKGYESAGSLARSAAGA